MMQYKNILTSRFFWLICSLAVLILAVFIFTFFNDRLYHTPIAKITNVEQVHQQKITDEHHNTDTTSNIRNIKW